MIGASIVVTLKVAESVPAGTTTLGGIAAASILLLVSAIVTSFKGAPFSVTVAIEVLLPRTVSGFSVIESTPSGLTVRFAPTKTPL